MELETPMAEAGTATAAERQKRENAKLQGIRVGNGLKGRRKEWMERWNGKGRLEMKIF